MMWGWGGIYKSYANEIAIVHHIWRGCPIKFSTIHPHTFNKDWLPTNHKAGSPEDHWLCCSWVPPSAALGFGRGCSEGLLALARVKGTALLRDFLMLGKGRAARSQRTRSWLLKLTLDREERRMHMKNSEPKGFLLQRIWLRALA